MPPEPGLTGPPAKDWVPSTHWSRLVPLDSSSEERERTYAYFYERYGWVVEKYFRPRVPSDDTARELAHEFFTKTLEREFLRRAQPSRGRFRAYLFTAAKRFLADWWRTTTRLKRAGQARAAPLDRPGDPRAENFQSYGQEPTPPDHFDRSWAEALVAAAVRRLEEFCRERGRSESWEVFRRRALDSLSSREIGDQTGLPPSRVDRIYFDAKRLFGQFLRDEVARTVPPDEVDDEIRELLRAMSS